MKAHSRIALHDGSASMRAPRGNLRRETSVRSLLWIAPMSRYPVALRVSRTRIRLRVLMRGVLMRGVLMRGSLVLGVGMTACVSPSVSHSDQSIIGGQLAGAHEFPTVIALENSPGNWFCTGTLIDKDWVLTAAHCVEGETAAT